MTQLTTPPFPQKMTFREMCNGLFNTDFLSPEEFTTICDAAEMYANGCLKQERERAGKLMEGLRSVAKVAKNPHLQAMAQRLINEYKNKP